MQTVWGAMTARQIHLTHRYRVCTSLSLKIVEVLWNVRLGTVREPMVCRFTSPRRGTIRCVPTGLVTRVPVMHHQTPGDFRFCCRAAHAVWPGLRSRPADDSPCWGSKGA